MLHFFKITIKIAFSSNFTLSCIPHIVQQVKGTREPSAKKLLFSIFRRILEAVTGRIHYLALLR